MQDAVVALPWQVHENSLVPPTGVAVPALQRFVVGTVATLLPLAEPQAPLIVDCKLKLAATVCAAVTLVKVYALLVNVTAVPSTVKVAV